jgi:hypothetical protein
LTEVLRHLISAHIDKLAVQKRRKNNGSFTMNQTRGKPVIGYWPCFIE